MRRILFVSLGLLAAGFVVAALDSCKSGAAPASGGMYMCNGCKSSSDSAKSCCGKEMTACNYVCAKCGKASAAAGQCCGADMTRCAMCTGCKKCCPVGKECCGKKVGP